ncbi:hypothetical protein NE865_00271 [Phthorimaea operculella]|nr:hypothetical protein NE865_00271 [Phthorimaea operculella]
MGLPPPIGGPAPMETQKRSFVSKNSLAIILDTDDGPVYCCVECPTKYTDKEKLEVHLCTHYDEYRFLCGICGTGLKRKEHLDRHVLGHQEVRPHVCDECGKGFKRKEHLNIHRSIHSGDKSQVCPLCHRSFYRKDHLQKHMQTHSKLFMSQHMVSLDDQEMMQVKQECMDDEDIKPVIDDQGDIAMKEEKKPVEQPLFIKSDDPQRPFECITCHKTYKRKDHLKLHSMTHVVKDKICSECGKAFHKEEQLLFHMNVHLGTFPELGQEQQFKVAPNAMVDHCDIGIMEQQFKVAPNAMVDHCDIGIMVS